MAGMDRSGLWRAVIAGATGLAVAVFAASASALPAGCTQSGTAVSCPFVSTGSEQQFVVPAGVFGVDVTAVGGKGGAGATTGGTGGTGGFGAAVTAQFAVTPGQVLYVEVGAIGGSAPSSSAAGAGGFNGGGAGAADSGVAASGGGGGASDVRTCSRASLSCVPGTASDTRLLVAAGGGGGGAGADANGGSGGTAGAAPAVRHSWHDPGSERRRRGRRSRIGRRWRHRWRGWARPMLVPRRRRERTDPPGRAALGAWRAGIRKARVAVAAVA